MAKKYIPGVSGLLTEPNPVDSPANTLSEAKNVIIDQRGKVQSRHGFNLKQNDTINNKTSYPDNPITSSLPVVNNIKGNARLIGSNVITGNFTLATDQKLILRTENSDTQFIEINFTAGTYSLLDAIDVINNYIISSSTLDLSNIYAISQGNQLIIESNKFLQVLKQTGGLTNTTYDLYSILGFEYGQYSYASEIFDSIIPSNETLASARSFENHVPVSSFYENDSFYLKFIELQNDVDEVVSGYIVKQNRNDYTRLYLTDITQDSYLLRKNTLSDTVYRIYRLDSDGQKFVSVDNIPFRDITSVYTNNKSMYLQTEDGLVETNINDVFQPTPNRYFTIRWPSFPELRFTFRKSDLFQNWFLSGHKCGFRYTFYRELGYSQEQDTIYESAPSKIYEIFNDGQDSVIDVEFLFNAVAESSDIYKEFNEFTSLNNGRKFGIKLYRTKLIPILTNDGQYNPLSAEYYQCYDFISFDTIFTTTITHEQSTYLEPYGDYSFDEIGVLSRFRRDDTRGEFNVGDVIVYLTKSQDNNIALESTEQTYNTTFPLYNGNIYSNKNVQYRQDTFDNNDIVPAKLRIVDKKVAGRTVRDASPIELIYDVYNSVLEAADQSDEIDKNQENIGYTYRNLDPFIKYVNTVEFLIQNSNTSQELDDIINSNTEFIVTLWEYEEPESHQSVLVDESLSYITLTNLLATGSCKPFLNTTASETTYTERPNILYNGDLNGYTSPNNNGSLGSLKITLNRIIELIPYKNILVTLKVKNLNSGSSIKLFRKTYSSVTTSVITDDSLLRNRVYEWLDGNSPQYISSLSNRTGVFVLSRSENIYHYNLETETYITDEMPYTQTYFSEKTPLKDFISPLVTCFIPDAFSLPSTTTKLQIDVEDILPPWFEVGAQIRLADIDNNIDEVNYSTTYIITSFDGGFIEIRANTTGSTNIVFDQGYSSRSFRIFLYESSKKVSVSGIYNNIDLLHTFSFTSTTTAHGLFENYPVRFYGDMSGSSLNPMSGLSAGTTYYVTFNPLLNLQFIQNDDQIITTDINGLPVYHNLTVGLVIRLTDVDNNSQGISPNINTFTYYKITEISPVSEYWIKIAKTSDPGNNMVPNFNGTGEDNPSLGINQFRIKQAIDSPYPLRVFGLTSLDGISIFGWQDNALTRYRSFIKEFKVPIEFNDDALYNDTVLYTNPNAESTDYTNYLAPKSVFSVPFKDYQIYAGIKKPLTATIAVVEQPGVEQLEIGLSLFTSLSQNSTRTIDSFTVLKSNKTFENTGIDHNLFIESSIFKDRPVQIDNISYSQYPYYTTDPYTPLSDLDVGEIQISVNEYCVDIILNNDTTSAIYYPAIKKYKFGATLFERPYLTLKLTSTNNDIEYVSAQLTPFYNRNGYYPLNDKNGEYDKRYLEANNTLDTLNYAQANTESGSLTTVTRAGLLPGMVEGTESGQAEADAKYSGTQININSSSNKVYYNSTANTLTITDINRFTKDKFEEPGLMLMQFIISTGVEAYAIVNYSNITTETNAVNKHVFKNITVSYISKNGVVIDPTPANLNTLRGSVINFWFMEGTTAENLPIYAYKEITTTKIDITHSTANILEYSIDSVSGTASKFPSIPGLVFKPHRDYESPQVGILNKNGSILFIGPAALDQSSYLDQYAWSIVETFNRELQNRGIKAYLTKPDITGYFEIVYPDGKQIEMLNGKYDPDTGNITYYGKHEFLPALNKDSFTKVAIQNNKAQFAKNEIKWSRRKIPEIVPLANSFVLGKDTKEFIGAAQSVDDLYLFKEDGIFRLRDAGNVGLTDIPALEGSSYQFSTTSICVSGGSIQEINNEIIYLDQNGFMSIIDGGINNISGAIQRDILTLIQTTPKNRIRSFKNEAKGLYYCTLINEVDDTLDVRSGTYIFSTKTRQWTFMDEEILDGMEDYMHRNLVAYRQKNTYVTTVTGNEDWSTQNLAPPAATNINEETRYKIDNSFEDITSKTSNYYITREFFTNNIMNNSQDQYDYATFDASSTGDIRNRMQIYNNYPYHNATNKLFRVLATIPYENYEYYPTYKYNDLLNANFFESVQIDIPSLGGLTSVKRLVDSPVSHFNNKTAFIRFSRIINNTPVWTSYYEVRLVHYSVILSSKNLFAGFEGDRVAYLFEFVNDYPDGFYDYTVATEIIGGISYTVYNSNFQPSEFDLLCGVPAKVTFNPESGTDPDTNKLFQEYMIHTETANKGATMAFKTDSRSNFSADRRFMYDANATNRNVFRTYIPTSMSRGRYLIRQVKHDLPLENLIITGQTIVMRDSGSTRVQKDGDNE